MAQVEIERKDRHAIWPWIIAAIIILLLLWWWASSRSNNENIAALTDSMLTATSAGAIATGGYANGASTSVNDAGNATIGTPPAVTEFSTWVAQAEPSRGAATAMKPGNNLLDQNDKVQDFFDAARDALQAMSQTS